VALAVTGDADGSFADPTIAGASGAFPAAAVFSVLFLEAWASAVPVLLGAGLAGVDSEAAQLGTFSQAALELGEAGEGGEADYVVPQPGRLLAGGQPLMTGPVNAGPRGARSG
jgi:hypothetical protein